MMTGASFSNAGTIRLHGDEAISGLVQDVSGGAWHYTGNGVLHAYTLGYAAYYDLVIDGVAPALDIFRIASPLTVHHDLSILSGELDSNGFDISLAGNWNNQGRFSAGTSRVILNGADQSILGATVFHDLSKEVSVRGTLTFEAEQTQTILGTLTLKGVAGGSLFLRSSVPGVQGKIDPQGTRKVIYVDIQDSNNINKMIVDCSRHCFDSGNSTGYSILSLGDDPLAVWNLDLVLSSGPHQVIPVNYLYGSALSNERTYRFRDGLEIILRGFSDLDEELSPVKSPGKKKKLKKKPAVAPEEPAPSETPRTSGLQPVLTGNAFFSPFTVPPPPPAAAPVKPLI